MQKDCFTELAYKTRSKLLRQMDASEKVLDDLRVTLQCFTPDLKVDAMSTELWTKYREIETHIKQKATEHDDILEQVTHIEEKYKIKMSEPY